MSSNNRILPENWKLLKDALYKNNTQVPLNSMHIPVLTRMGGSSNSDNILLQNILLSDILGGSTGVSLPTNVVLVDTELDPVPSKVFNTYKAAYEYIKDPVNYAKSPWVIMLQAGTISNVGLEHNENDIILDKNITVVGNHTVIESDIIPMRYGESLILSMNSGFIVNCIAKNIKRNIEFSFGVIKFANCDIDLNCIVQYHLEIICNNCTIFSLHLPYYDSDSSEDASITSNTSVTCLQTLFNWRDEVAISIKNFELNNCVFYSIAQYTYHINGRVSFNNCVIKENMHIIMHTADNILLLNCSMLSRFVVILAEGVAPSADHAIVISNCHGDSRKINFPEDATVLYYLPLLPLDYNYNITKNMDSEETDINI